jgi:hypothetical protein
MRKTWGCLRLGRCELFAGPRRITTLVVCGHECLGLIDEIGIIRIEREKKEEEERPAAEVAAAAEEARLIAEEEKWLKEEAEGKNKKGKRGRGGR